MGLDPNHSWFTNKKSLYVNEILLMIQQHYYGDLEHDNLNVDDMLCTQISQQS